MSDTFSFSLHGSSVIPEFTPDLKGHDNDLRLTRTGNGATASQKDGTKNWFHFAFQTPTRLDDDIVRLHDVRFDFALNSGCRVTHFNIHSGAVSVGVKHRPPNEIVTYRRPVIYRGTNSKPEFFPASAVVPASVSPPFENSGDIRRAWDFQIFSDDLKGVRIGSAVIFSIGVDFGGFTTILGRHRGEIWFSQASARFEEQ